MRLTDNDVSLLPIFSFLFHIAEHPSTTARHSRTHAYACAHQHLSSTVHRDNARDPKNFVRLDEIPRRHAEALAQQAAQQEADSKRLHEMLVKHPFKCAEMPWLFPKVTRMLEVRERVPQCCEPNILKP